MVEGIKEGIDIARKRCQNGRVRLGSTLQRYLWARSGAHCANPSCRVYLFADVGELRVDVGELAHIIAASDYGPRSDSNLPAMRRAEADNVVLLCATCHTKVDKAPGFYTVEMLREWQRRHMVELENVFGAIEYATRAEAVEAAHRLLAQNRAVFDTYGPNRAQREGKLGNEWARQWRRKVREIIMPNNRRLLALYDRNRRLMNDREQEVVELLRQHVDDLEARHFRGTAEPGSVRFPTEVDTVFSDG